ncbi:MAG: hypothetical protein IJA63_03495 [Akkermansia sp.]|nr:hypothetical protein [Akkermansia sp.]
MKKTLFITSFWAVCAVATFAEDASVKETLTLTSDKISEESFTETAAGNGMFYSDANGVAFLGTGTMPYYITQADDTLAGDSVISISKTGGTTVSVGAFAGESHLVVGNGTDSMHVTAENGIFVGGYGWHNTSGWRTNAALSSNTEGALPFAAHEGSILINKGSVLEVGTGLGSDFKTLAGAQLYIGHGAKGTVTVDGGELISHAFIGVSTANSLSDDNSGLLEIKNGGTVTIKAEPEKMSMNGYSYNQFIVGASNNGTGGVVISGEGSSLVLESSASADSASQTYYSFASIGQGGQGEVTVTDGASLSLGTDANAASQISIGESGGTGTLNVEKNASADLTGNVIVGFSGDGSVNVASGGEVVQSGGNLCIGYGAGASGEVTVAAESSLEAENLDIGYSGAAGSLSVEADAAVAVAGNVNVFGPAEATQGNGITNAGSISVGGYVNLTSGSELNNTGTMDVTGLVYVQSGAAVENSGTLSSESGVVVYSGSSVTNSGTINADLILDDGVVVTNDGVLSGSVNGAGTVQGSGEIGTISLGELSTFVVGEPITGLEVSGDFTMGAGSTTVFNVAGMETAAAAGSSDTWSSCSYANIIMQTEDGVVTIADDACVSIVFGGDTIFDASLANPDNDNRIEWVFSLTLISSGVSGEVDLEKLLSNTDFSITTDAVGIPSIGGTVSVSNASYSVTEQGALVLSGTLTIPEPSTATLSLFALAALAMRRRRR